LKKERLKELEKKSGSFGYVDLAGRPSIDASQLYTQRLSFADSQLLVPKEEKRLDEVPDLSSRISKSIKNALRTSIPGLGRPAEGNLPPSEIASSARSSVATKSADLVKVKVVLKWEGFKDQELVFTIHKSRDVQDLITKTQGWLCENFNFLPQEGQTFKLFFKNRALDAKHSLTEAGITDEATIFV